MRRAAKRDAAEPGIVRALLAAGCTVARLSDADLPDLLVGYRGRNVLLEVKSPGGRIRPGQAAFSARWRGQTATVWDIAAALAAAGVTREATQAAEDSPGWCSAARPSRKP